MAPSHIRTAALLVAGIVLTTAPSFAQRDGGRHGGDGGGRESDVRAQPRRGGESRVESRGRVEARGGIEPRGRVEARGRVEPYRGYGNRTYGGRAYDRRSFGDPSYGNRSYGSRSSGYRSHGSRSYGNRSYGSRSYGYRPYVNRLYVIPYGYRPHGHRPGWNLNLYFGRPYSAYGYPAYAYPAYAYPSAEYGYYAIAPGRAYGAIRILDAPFDAQVFVDGYYAGVVDDYDGVFQHLNLEAGPHRIEIEARGHPPIAFDVRVLPGQTITYRANIQ